MQEYQNLYEIALSLVLGFFIGLEREYKVKGEVFAGIRTFPLITLLGYISSLISDFFV
ncbi:MgtC/SapB family protein [Sulfurihydrogenibium sp.]|uniref:MgtC/SapB family protein n=1 Tax=Sulfurihydrogenibium sp. TaxID=2053621 RepID=UPI00262770A8|nr:MgtC/SapB family protein [Sulfurihydrogenibium sp.]